MPVFNVEIEGVIVVVAASEDDAMNKAQEELWSYGMRFSKNLTPIIAYPIERTGGYQPVDKGEKKIPPGDE